MKLPKHFPLTLTLLFWAFGSQSQEYKYGLGLRVASDQSIVGSGVSLKYFFNANSAVEALISFNPTSIGAMGVVGLDYTFAKAPVNLSVDWKPEFILSREVGFEPAAVGLSVRFVMK